MFMYQRIDVNDDGFIEFSEFVNYLITAESQFHESTNNGNTSNNNSSKLVMLRSQEPTSASNHKEMVDHICFHTKPCPMCITASRDGKIIIWNPQTLEKMAEIDHMDKHSVYREMLIAELPSVEKAQLLSHSKPTQDSLIALVTCMCVLPDTGHICIGSADNSLTIYELGTQVLRLNFELYLKKKKMKVKIKRTILIVIVINN
jgi:WD40 repeat protein